MAMVILNPTDDPISVKWNGLDHKIESNQREKFEEKDGKQILHNYRDRGLIDLDYGDEGEIELQKIKAGRIKCDEFWTRQIVNYNQMNEERQAGNRPFIRPTKEVMYHAKRLGIKLLEPYRLQDSATQELKALLDRNRALEAESAKKDKALDVLKDQVSELTENFKKMMAFASPPAADPAPAEEEKPIDTTKPGEVKATIQRMHKKQFAGWLDKNWEEIESYSDDVKQVVEEKHLSLLGTSLPKERPPIEVAA